MTAVTQEQRHAQLQAQMTVCLDALRRKVATQMIETIDRIQARPRLKGDKTLPTLASDPRLNRDDSGAMVLGFSMGVPGLSDTMESIADVGMELYGSRKATIERPQDSKELSFKEICKIKEDNERDMKLFASLGEKLDLLDTYIVSGYSKGAIVGETLFPLDKEPEAVLRSSHQNMKNNNDNKIKISMPKLGMAS